MIVRMPELDCFRCYRISHAMRNFTSGKSDVYVLVAAVRHGFKMVSFTEAVSHQNTFVGGTCAPPSALLVIKRRCMRQMKLDDYVGQNV